MREILVMDCEMRGTFWTNLKSDYKILFAPTAERGLDMLSENTGLVFLSLNSLPDMDGIEALGRIKKAYPSTAVIITASCGTEEPCMCKEAFKKGAWDYMRKPLKAEEVLRKIEAALNDAVDVSQTSRCASLPVETAQGERYPDVPPHLVSGVLRVRDFVVQNHSESLSLAAACRMAATSKTYFCRYFKHITGHSLRNYHHVVKIQRAEELLRDRRLSVTDVAIELGYSDSNYFSTVYKKVTGISPKYRKTAAPTLSIKALSLESSSPAGLAAGSGPA